MGSIKWKSPSLPPALITAVRSGFDAFVQLQRRRFDAYTDMLNGGSGGSKYVTAAVGVVPAPQASGTMFPETLCQWSDLFFSRLKASGDGTFVDPTVEVVWELVSIVLGILENGGESGAVVNGHYIEWYRGRFVHSEEIDQVLSNLRSAALGVESVLTDIAGPCMVAVQRSFLTGLFSHTAHLISTFVGYLRSFGTDIFSAEEESALTDVVQLLLNSPEDGRLYGDWAGTANALVVDSKRILGGGRTGHSAASQVAQQMKSLCLDILLMISGDATLIMEACYLLDLDVMDYVTAICVVCGPPMTLQQIYHLFRTTRESWEPSGGEPWYTGVVEELLGCRCVSDVVGVMHFVCKAVTKGEHFQSTAAAAGKGRVKDDSNIVSSPMKARRAMALPAALGCLGCCGDAQEEKLLRSFSLLFMAAHVADICSPPLGAPVDQINVTFIRNEVIRSYIELFRRHPLLWRTAATYVVYSPFMNPALLFRIVVGQSANAVRDRYTCLSLHTFIQSSWEDNCTFQLALRRLLHDKYPMSTTVNKWIDSVDFYRRKAIETLNGKTIRERYACGDTASAVWLALESQQTKSIQVHLEATLRSSDALLSEEVYRVGQALSNSFISIDASDSLRMLGALRACAALFEYRKSCADLQQGAGDRPKVRVEATRRVLHAADKVLQCAVPLRLHPEVVLCVVNHAADAALTLPRSQKPYMQLPRLSNALELMLVTRSDNPDGYEAKAAIIREKLMMLL
uniref:Nuclear pore complex protein n=1 Tax=Trypanosoma congolense (strain IL3000) TaxID=1068625 RepID=G0UUY8_TRYCI|nr:conserved hypothetical protein [Trypanosoma congolense IL3000]